MRIFSVFCIAFLKAYQYIVAPIFISLGVRCRFEPSCSHYAVDAVKIHGAVKGVILAFFRLGRCHPLCNGGHDPVPSKFRIIRSIENG